MAPQPPPDVVLDVYLDGRLVYALYLNPEAFARAAVDAPAAPPEAAAAPDRPSRGVVEELPRSGRLRLAVHLRRPPEDGRAPPSAVTTYTYDPSASRTGLTGLAGLTTTVTYEAPPRPPQAPPDDPHIVG
jgi:hypothetical protein